MHLESKPSNQKIKLLGAYTVHYRTHENKRIENCFYAADAYEARMLAMEFNNYIQEHPNCIDLIRCEVEKTIH